MFDSCGFDHFEAELGSARILQRDLVVRSLMPRFAPGPNTPSDGGPARVDGVETHFRFCQEDPNVAGGLCRAPANVDYRELHLNDAEESSHPYHRIKLLGTPRGLPVSMDYDDVPRTRRWDFEADVAYWNQNGLVTVPDDDTFTSLCGTALSASGLQGVMWTHADDPRGHFGNDEGQGVHGPDFGDEPQLAGSYVDIRPEYIQTTGGGRGLQLDRPFFIWQTLPDPPWESSINALIRPWDKAIVVAGPEETWGILQLDGRRLDGDVLGEGLRESLAQPGLVWANAVEPWVMQGGDPMLDGARPIAIAIDPASASLADAVRIAPDGRALLGGSDRSVPKVATAGARTASAGAVDAVVVYSRFFGEVWLFGSEMADVPSGTAAWAPLDGRESLVARGFEEPLGHVLAATLAKVDGRLWVLDEVPATPRPVLRLLRIERRTGAVEVLASTGAARNFEHYAMSIDRDGKVLLQGSRGGLGSSRGHHVVFRVEAYGGQLVTRRVHQGTGALALPILVQERDAILWLRDRGAVAGLRLEHLTGPTIPSGGLGAAL